MIFSALLQFIGEVRTPFHTLGDCPFQGARSARECILEIYPEYQTALRDVETCTHLIVLYWLHQGDRTRRLEHVPHHLVKDDGPYGVFATRTPNRPNPIGQAVVRLRSVQGGQLRVIGLDCLDQTPLVDLKPYSPEIDSFPEAVMGWWERGGGRL